MHTCIPTHSYTHTYIQTYTMMYIHIYTYTLKYISTDFSYLVYTVISSLLLNSWGCFVELFILLNIDISSLLTVGLPSQFKYWFSLRYTLLGEEKIFGCFYFKFE